MWASGFGVAEWIWNMVLSEHFILKNVSACAILSIYGSDTETK